MPHVDFSRTFSPIFACLTGFSWIKVTRLARVADVKVPQYRRYPKGQRLLQKEGPPTYAILSQNLVLSRFTRFLNGHHRAFYKSHPTLGVFSTKVSLLLKGFQQKSACLGRFFFKIKASESFFKIKAL